MTDRPGPSSSPRLHVGAGGAQPASKGQRQQSGPGAAGESDQPITLQAPLVSAAKADFACKIIGKCLWVPLPSPPAKQTTQKPGNPHAAGEHAGMQAAPRHDRDCWSQRIQAESLHWVVTSPSPALPSHRCPDGAPPPKQSEEK